MPFLLTNATLGAIGEFEASNYFDNLSIPASESKISLYKRRTFVRKLPCVAGPALLAQQRCNLLSYVALCVVEKVSKCRPVTPSP